MNDVKDVDPSYDYGVYKLSERAMTVVDTPAEICTLEEEVEGKNESKAPNFAISLPLART